MTACMADDIGGFNPKRSPEYIELAKKGFILKEVTGDKVTSEVVMFEEKAVPASEFAIPSGYEKVSFPEMMKRD